MPNVPDGPFLGPRLKIARAKQHISHLNTVLQTFLDGNPYVIIIEQDPDSRNHNWTIRVRGQFPQEVELILGDAIHNLRAALDLLATDLVRPNATEDLLNKVYFPFAEHPNDLDGRIKLRNIHLAGPDIVSIMKAHKPYPRGNDLLYGLHRLDIADKHTSTIASTQMAGIPNFQLHGVHGLILSMTNYRFGPLKDGSVPISMPPAGNLKLGAELVPAVHIVFGHGQPFEGEPIIATLHQLVSAVEGVIESFVPYA